LHADNSTTSGFAAAVVWLGVAVFTLVLPKTPPGAAVGRKTWRSVMGWDAFALLENRDHRTVFITAALFSAPLAAFYPFAAMHLRDLGEPRVSAAMSLGQISEIISMYALAPLLGRFRLKWIFFAGICFGVIRYAIDTRAAVLLGVSLHGFCFTLFFISAQIYLERRIDPQFRTRAQALMAFMMSGVGNLTGSLGSGWWRQGCTGANGTDWTLYWSVLCGVTICVGVFFLASYRGIVGLRPIERGQPGELPTTAEPLNGPNPE
jgi:hypothetical protein